MKRAVAIAALAVLSFAMRALAEEPLELEWEAPRGCPTREDVLKEVTRIVATSEVRRRVQATAKVSGGGEKWSLALATREGSGEGERTLEGRSCKAVASAAALVLALTLQTDPEPAPDASSSPPASTAPSLTPSALPTVPKTPPPPPSPVVPFARAGAGVSTGAVPGASAVVAAGMGGRWQRFEASASFAYVGETSRLAEGSASAGGRFGVFAIGGSACAMPIAFFDRTRMELWACVGAEAMITRGESFGVDCGSGGLPSCVETYTTLAPLVVPRITLAPLSSLAFVGDFNLSFPLERRRFVVAGADRVLPVFRGESVPLRVTVTMELRF